jgi:hypothetical protein
VNLPQPPEPAPPSKAPYAITALYVTALVVFCVIERRILFAWPSGIVTGNLIASAIWAPIAVVHLDQLARKHHKLRMALARRHHDEQMQAINGGQAQIADGSQE